MTAASKLARAEARLTYRWQLAFMATGGTEAAYLRALKRYQAAARAARLRRNQAGGA